jgi:hypothetical protein
LADSAGEEFVPFYGIMAGLKSCATIGLEQQGGVSGQVKNSFELKKLRGSALEAATIVGAAVSGPEGENVEMYAQDASDIMTIATTLLISGSTAIPMDQLLAACARIAAVMGARYVPFLPSVLPHILKRATEKLDVSITVSAVCLRMPCLVCKSIHHIHCTSRMMKDLIKMTTKAKATVFPSLAEVQRRLRSILHSWKRNHLLLEHYMSMQELWVKTLIVSVLR